LESDAHPRGSPSKFHTVSYAVDVAAVGVSSRRVG
jgi:hypothetical protein